MRHSERDARDAQARARGGYSGSWHPILAAVEVEVGTWQMVAQYGRVYAIVRLLEIGGERGYRVVTWAERSEDRNLVGYYRTLRAAAERAHGHFVKSHGSDGFAPAPWPSSHGDS